MNILVLNGSPKGKNSLTLQTALYFERRFPSHKFDVLHVGQKIKLFEKDFSSAIKAFEKAELIIFAYPVYTFIVPYQLHRFIELMKENSVDLTGKITTQLSTSKHFYDVTAHKFIEEICYDFSSFYLDGLSADMDDLLSVKGRRQADMFFQKLLFDVECSNFKTKERKSISEKSIYQKQFTPCIKTDDKKIVLLTNCADEDENLKNMIDDFIALSKYKIKVINIRKYPFSGGCLGCMDCSETGECIYKDNFVSFLKNEIIGSDGYIYAYTIENHFTHSSFKCYDDRQFCNGHRVLTNDSCVAYLLSGNYSSEHNLQTIIEARSEIAHQYLCGVATDENDTANSIKKLVSSFDFSVQHKLTKPQNFYGVGGTKIFRDLIYIMQGIMKADHKHYKRHGVYDFPHKSKGKIFQMKLIGSIMSLPSVKRKMKGKMNTYVLMPYTKVIDSTSAFSDEKEILDKISN